MRWFSFKIQFPLAEQALVLDLRQPFLTAQNHNIIEHSRHKDALWPTSPMELDQRSKAVGHVIAPTQLFRSTALSPIALTDNHSSICMAESTLGWGSLPAVNPLSGMLHFDLCNCASDCSPFILPKKPE